MEIMRIMSIWNGFTGAPGYTSLYFAGGGGVVSDAQQVVDRVATAFRMLEPALPNAVTIQVQSEVEVLDSDTGMLLRYEDTTAPTPVEGISSTNFSSAAGAVVNWRTNDLRFGRRIRGRTFLVPLAVYDGDGSLGSTSLEAANDFGSTLVGGDLDSEFGVWSRPRQGAGGVFATAVAHNVPDMTAVLRSRRD